MERGTFPRLSDIEQLRETQMNQGCQCRFLATLNDQRTTLDA